LDVKKRKPNWICELICRNCILKQVIGGKIEGRIEGTRRHGRRRKQLLVELKETRKFWKFGEEALDRFLWRNNLEMSKGFSYIVR
jgi:hypothetical protein